MSELLTGFLVVGALALLAYWTVVFARWLAMKPLVKLLFWIAVVATALWAVVNHERVVSRSFESRWEPVIKHPLYMRSYARQGYCFPQLCRVG